MGYGVDETQKVVDDGKGWVWLAAEMSPGGGSTDQRVDLFVLLGIAKAFAVVAHTQADPPVEPICLGLYPRAQSTLHLLEEEPGRYGPHSLILGNKVFHGPHHVGSLVMLMSIKLH